MHPFPNVAALVATALLASQPAFAEDPMTAQHFADARLAAFGAGDIDTLLAQYSGDAMVFTPMGVLQGPAQIRTLLEPTLADFGQQGTTFDLKSVVAEGNTVALVWSAETPTTHYALGVETYVLADGKAVYQTLVVDAAPR